MISKHFSKAAHFGNENKEKLHLMNLMAVTHTHNICQIYSGTNIHISALNFGVQSVF